MHKNKKKEEEKMKSIAIDGPAGAGKSTIARILAKKMGYIYVDTGAMYRSMALACLRKKIDKNDEKAVCEVCEKADIAIRYENGEQVVLLNQENVNGFIRTEEVGNITSAIAVYPEVREKLVELQRKLADEENVVMDGRDIGTTVLPNADTKIFLTASVEVRAQRRYLELKEKNISCNLEEIEKDIKERDDRDSHREVSPLAQANDAILVDASDLTINEVVDKIMTIASKK